MRIETKYHCSFCDDVYWCKDSCEEHELVVHQCYHCKNLIIWTKDKQGSLDCSCDAKCFNRNIGHCRYYVEGKPNKDYYIEEENED